MNSRNMFDLFQIYLAIKYTSMCKDVTVSLGDCTEGYI